MVQEWSPGIGDPTPLGWLTVIAYLLACFLTVRAAFHDAPRNRLVWLGMATFLALLAINKQLDLQSLMTALVRELARTEGWYERRRAIQEVFIIGLLALSAAAALSLVRLTRGRPLALRVATLGMIFLLLFVCVRAASFHHMDEFLRVSFLASTMNNMLELCGIAFVALAAAMIHRSDRLRRS